MFILFVIVLLCVHVVYSVCICLYIYISFYLFYTLSLYTIYIYDIYTIHYIYTLLYTIYILYIYYMYLYVGYGLSTWVPYQKAGIIRMDPHLCVTVAVFSSQSKYTYIYMCAVYIVVYIV